MAKAPTEINSVDRRVEGPNGGMLAMESTDSDQNRASASRRPVETLSVGTAGFEPTTPCYRP